jgi:antitoxin component YwqK of YwqJK toxin-antitoxin module
MRGKHIVIFLLCALTIGCSKNGVVETKYPNGKLKERFTSAKDSTGHEDEVKYESWYDNGQKKKYEEFNEGKRNGVSVSWHENGQTEDSTNFIAGKEIDGKKVGWHKNGQKSYEYEVKNGLPNWKKALWYESGKVRQEVDYKNGQPTGIVYEWYESGKKKTEWKIENVQEVEYKNAQAIAKVYEWYESGKKAAEWILENGKTREGHRWYESGKKKAEWKFENEKPKVEAEAKINLGTGKWTEWDENGKVTKEDVYKNGVQIK